MLILSHCPGTLFQEQKKNRKISTPYKIVIKTNGVLFLGGKVVEA
jgi:hypothetical protein